MNYIAHTIHFPPAVLADPAFVGEYLARYTDPATGWAAAYRDRSDDPTSQRKASLFREGEALPTIAPIPVYEPPLSEVEIENGTERTPAALSITCYWPADFLDQLARDPQPEPELFAGVEIVE